MAKSAMIHSVYFYLKPGLAHYEHKAFVEAVRKLGDIPTVQAFYGGEPAATEERDVIDDAYDYAIHLHFASVADHDAYQVDPGHVQFVETQKHTFAEVKVYDCKI